jgi:dienelactone hydrolase
LFILFVTHARRVEGEDLPTGKIIESVTCRADTSFSYALYVPSSYDPKKKWPALFAFDPGARGLVPVERFKDAAETYGYIVAGSNNSRNGPWAPSAKAIQAMWNDVVERFAIDERRIYATGFSGGARVACRLGYSLKGQIAGVIACGAGFPPEMAPARGMPFVFFGTAGIEDFNYAEMRQLDRTLDALDVTHRVEIFEGGHGWAPTELCTRALEWMEVQAMKSALRARSEPLIDTLINKQVERARALEAAGSIFQAHAAYSGIAEEFKGLREVAEFERKVAALKDAKEVRQALKLEKDQEAEQRTRSAELYRLRARLGMPSTPGENDERTIALGDLKRAVADLKKRSEMKESTSDRALARRLLNEFMVSSFESSMALLDGKDYDRAVSSLTVDAEIMPDNWRVHYRLACAYSLKGDKKKAIEALKKSVQKGLSNAADIENNNSLDPIKEETAYKKILEELKAKR